MPAFISFHDGGFAVALDFESLGVSQDELTQLVVDRLVENVYSWGDSFNEVVKKAVNKAVDEKVDDAVTKALNEALEQALDETVSPVNIFGERTGDDTTIRQALATRAQSFWFEKVDKDGTLSSYGGQPRYSWLISRKMHDEFTAAVAENSEVLVAEFRKALKADLAAKVSEQIEKILPAKRR